MYYAVILGIFVGSLIGNLLAITYQTKREEKRMMVVAAAFVNMAH